MSTACPQLPAISGWKATDSTVATHQNEEGRGPFLRSGGSKVAIRLPQMTRTPTGISSSLIYPSSRPCRHVDLPRGGQAATATSQHTAFGGGDNAHSNRTVTPVVAVSPPDAHNWRQVSSSGGWDRLVGVPGGC